MKNWIPFLSLTVISINAHAESFIKYGIGVAGSAKDSIAESKTIALGYKEKLLGAFAYQLEGGFWTDSRKDLGRTGSAFASSSLGLNIEAGYFYTHAFCGPAVITDKDSMLGGHFQFNNDIGLGVKDKDGYSMGVNYKHISSAGIFTPNQGRDFLTIKLGVPF